MYLNEEVNALDNIASLYNSDGGNDVIIPKSFSHENLIIPKSFSHENLINPINHGNKQPSQHKGFTTVTAIGTIIMMMMMIVMMMMMIVMMMMMMMMMRRRWRR